MVANPDYDKDVRESFARQGMLATLGAHISRLTPGEVWLMAPITPDTSQQDGFAHAGLAWSLGDSAAGYAALSLFAAGERVLTSEMKINLLRPASGSTLVAKGRVLRAGRLLTTVASDIYTFHGRDESHVATMLGTMVRLSE